MTDDPFFARLRHDAARLRLQPDELALTRIRARIRERIARPTVAQLLAAWFRPLAATLSALALAAALSLFARNDAPVTIADDTLQISVAGETYSVGQ
ncbi:MAG TPA: hypothetical protein VF824_06320 [Thermoanaerobaculia bacterium]|jgi:hypothetical protein